MRNFSPATASEKVECNRKVTVVASDSDVLVMLVDRIPNGATINLLIPSAGSHAARLYVITAIQNEILFVYAMSGLADVIRRNYFSLILHSKFVSLAYRLE